MRESGRMIPTILNGITVDIVKFSLCRTASLSLLGPLPTKCSLVVGATKMSL